MTTVRPMRDKILIHNFKKGTRNIGGIIIPDDDGSSGGVRPRWAQVYAIGEDVEDINVDDWVLIEHGRWTRELPIPELETVLWGVDPDCIMLATEEEPIDDGFGFND